MNKKRKKEQLPASPPPNFIPNLRPFFLSTDPKLRNSLRLNVFFSPRQIVIYCLLSLGIRGLIELGTCVELVLGNSCIFLSSHHSSKFNLNASLTLPIGGVHILFVGQKLGSAACSVFGSRVYFLSVLSPSLSRCLCVRVSPCSTLCGFQGSDIPQGIKNYSRLSPSCPRYLFCNISYLAASPATSCKRCTIDDAHPR